MLSLNHCMRIGLLSLSAVMVCLTLRAQTADDIAKDGDLLVKNLKEEDAYQKYKEALVVQPDNLHALVQYSYVATRIGNRQKDKKQALAFYTEAQDYAGRALKVDSTSSDASLMMAFALYRLAFTESAKKRVEMDRDVKSFCEQAIRQDPRNYRAYYLLGIWNLLAAHMSGVERAEAKVLYGGLPQATTKDAIRCFEKCRSIYPSYMLNYLDLAKTYKEDDQNEKAIAALQVLVKLPVQTEDDPGIKAEGRTMLEAMM